MRIFSFLLCLVCFSTPALAAAPETTLTIATGQKNIEFNVDLASTESEQNHGLMFRTSLPEHYGMIFDFHKPRPIQMWMKNTLIPLDMIFIDNSGTITGIAERAVPESTAIINSPGAARAVLEVAGGTASQYYIAKGDKVLYPIFK